MSPFFVLRLWLDGLAAVLLLFGFAYWWLGNIPHELAGTAMFLLLIAHNIFNRRWYGTLRRVSRLPRSILNLVVTALLTVAILALLATSVLLSNALAPVMPAWGGFTVRQIHTLAAYWVLVIVAIHLGLRWPLLMGVGRTLFNWKAQNRLRSWALRAIAAAIACHGIWSFSVLGIAARLTMQMSLDWWNFEEAVAGYFIHLLAIMGLIVVTTYYSARLMQRQR